MLFAFHPGSFPDFQKAGVKSKVNLSHHEGMVKRGKLSKPVDMRLK